VEMRKILPALANKTMDSKQNSKIWIAIVVIVVVIAAAWFLFARPEKATAPDESPTDASISKLQKVGTSDNVSAIESDLNATDLSDLTGEMGAIESELGQ